MNTVLLIKQFITFFIEPLGLSLSLISIGLYFIYKHKNSLAKVFVFLGLFVLLLFSYPPFVNYLVKNLEDQYPKYAYKEKITYIHVLGSGHNTDLRQPTSSHLSACGTKRVLEGILIHKKIPNSKIIFTGYSGDTNISNALMNADLAKELGVKQEDMIINGTPVDTKEEALYLNKLVGKEPFVLVTSAIHIPRAMRICHSLGMNPIAAPTAFYQKEMHSYFKAPSLDFLRESEIAMHEYIGILWSIIRD